MDLGEFREPLTIETAAWYLTIFEDPLSFEELAMLSEDVSAKLRVLAVTALLVEANSNRFCHHLIRSALIRINFLEHCLAESKLQNFRRASSRNEPLFDAMAAGDFERAQKIASLSPKEWLSNAEYEDDYAYTQVIHRLIIQDSNSSSEIQMLMDQFERTLEGNPTPRFTLCHALRQRDQEAFDEAFEDLLTERDNKIAAEEERGRMEEPESLADQRVFVEGLGVLRLADRLGFVTQPEYRYCPAVARLPMTQPFPRE